MTELDREKCFDVIQGAGPVIRYRTAIELQGCENSQIETLRDKLLSSELVKEWLGILRPRFDRNMHGSTSNAYENIMGKLYDFGLRRGVRELDARVQPYLDLLNGKTQLEDIAYMGNLYITMVAGFLAMTGYGDDKGVQKVLTERLDRIHDYVSQGDLSDFFVSHEEFRGIPKAFKYKRLVNPRYYDERGLALPTIYDVLGFLHSENLMDDSVERNKIENIIKLILSDEYQNLPEGFGYVWKPPRKYYAMGWSVHLPLFSGEEMSWREFSRLVFYLIILKCSRVARSHQWFSKSLNYLLQFVDDEGVPLLPSKALPEKNVGYWVTGSRLGLEPGRRTKKVIRNESAFRVLTYLS